MIEKLVLYCNSYKGIDPFHEQFNQKTIMCGSALLEENVKKECIEKNYILDDTGDNISYLNKVLGDLTGLYWVWKNSNHEFVGVNQYLRYYDDNYVKNLSVLDEKTVYVLKHYEFNTSVWEQYTNCHGHLGTELLKVAILQNSVPISIDMFNSLHKEKALSPCNTFFAHNTIFNKLCKVFIEIILELYNGSKYILPCVQHGMHSGRPDDLRLLAFLAERILNIIYLNPKYFLGNDVKIHAVPWYIKNRSS